MIRNGFLLLLILWATVAQATPEIKYTLSFPEPQTHYVKVKMEIKGWSQSTCKLKLPVWAPGSYLIREFSRFLEQFQATSNGSDLEVSRFRKNGWEVKNGSEQNFTVEYYIYAYELTVRTSFVDIDHAYLNGTSIFLYIDERKNIPVTVQLNPYNEWKKISVALDRVEKGNPWLLKAEDYDELVDAPFEIGNHDVFSFTAAGINHDVAIYGGGFYDTEAIKRDFTKLIEEEVKIFGEHPCKNYLFIVHLTANASGGLEHKNSTTIQASRNALTTISGYNNFISLAAHEYFHLWNVKRLRPYPLGPFDYDNENYTSLLYFSEGFTSYYDEKVTVKCGLVKPDNYLKTIASAVSSLENQPGNKFQSLKESSYDAWIKYYRSNENSSNATVSYYSKGAIIGLLLDISLLDITKGEKGLDDLMKQMYKDFYLKNNRGFTEAELLATTNKLCNCDMEPFFKNYIYFARPVPYREIFLKAGVEIKDLNEGLKTAYAGFNTTSSSGKFLVSSVERNGAAWIAGLNVNDELIAVNSIRVTDDPQKILAQFSIDDVITILVSRGGVIREIKLKMAKSSKVNYELKRMENASELQKKVFAKWLE